MLALAGYPLGLQVRVFDPASDACAGDVAQHTVGEYADLTNLARFSEGIDVVTFEFENVPVEAARFVADRVALHPTSRILEIAQDRVREKQFFRAAGLTTARFATLDTQDDLRTSLGDLQFPGVMKTKRMGYDGKGQVVISTRSEVAPAWKSLGEVSCIVEEFVAFDRELSLIMVRDGEGRIETYPWVENEHRGGILRVSRAPAVPRDPSVGLAVVQRVEEAMHGLGYVGVLAVEFFEADGVLVANEMAPRVHNSGHWTIDGAKTSQFANHVRAVTGLPIGTSRMSAHAGMVNVIGNPPAIDEVLALPSATVHMYGKQPRPGRKVGHINIVEPTSSERDSSVAIVRAIVDRAADDAGQADTRNRPA
jgi:5-(carboxyamino)imidazole ribonucleotide synthase